MRNLTCVLLFLSGASIASSQIGVNVNDRPVMFAGQRPVQVSGRVLVPLRGVLEAMGAYVDFEPSTRTIRANRGNSEIEMRLGDRSAMVNGSRTMLDIPAMTMRGSTMVPLRFVGEALGADVRWNEVTQTVDIWTADSGGGNTGGGNTGGGNTGGGNTGGGNTGGGNVDTGEPLEITSIDVKGQTEWLKPGDLVEVEMVATPGVSAAFRIPGLVERVEMREEGRGVYRGAWRVPTGTSLSGAKILGEITRGNSSRLIQASDMMNVDTTAPRISGLIPEENNRVPANRLSISAVFDDSSGSGIDTKDVSLRVDNRDVTNEASVTSTFISWRPDNITAGRHTAVVRVTDRAGNTTQKSWNFTVSTATTAIQSFTHDATGRLEPGDVITATLRGERGADITFAIAGRRGIRMEERSPGVYVGEYVVRRGDNFSNAPIVATMKTSEGETFTVEADKKVNATVGGPDRLQITSPKDGTAVASPLVVQGKAAPGARVFVQVGYATTVVGGLRLTGRLFEDEVVADANGNWRTPGITLRNSIRGDNVTYPVTVSLVVPEGQEAPDPISITLRRKE